MGVYSGSLPRQVHPPMRPVENLPKGQGEAAQEEFQRRSHPSWSRGSQPGGAWWRTLQKHSPSSGALDGLKAACVARMERADVNPLADIGQGERETGPRKGRREGVGERETQAVEVVTEAHRAPSHWGHCEPCHHPRGWPRS